MLACLWKDAQGPATRLRSWRAPLTSVIVLLLGLGAIAQPACAEDDPVPGSRVDIAAVADKLVFLGDGHGHSVALIPFHADSWAHVYWSPDGKKFVAQRVTGGSAQGTEKFDKILWEPRVEARWQAAVGMSDGKYWVQCFDRKTELQPIGGAERDKLLKAEFVAPTWDRRAYALARDERGVYWFVDRGVGEKSKQFRVFMGQRGQLAAVALTNVVSDSEGDIFATKKGTLRLVLNRSESTWIEGKNRSKLVVLPIEDNRRLIYRELGPYLTQRLGTPCDDL